MLDYQEAVRLISEYWFLGGEYKFAISKTIEYPFGWLFFFDTLCSEEEQEKIGLIYFAFSGIFPSIIDKNNGTIHPVEFHLELPFNTHRAVKKYALANGYEWKPEWEVEFDKNTTYFKFE